MTFYHSKSLLLFYIYFSCIIYFAASQKHYCDPDTRPDITTCPPEAPPFKPTCAYYKQDCPLKICGQHASNPCEACSSKNILYYENHECRPEEVLSKCFNNTCDTEVDPQQNKVFEPVCGYRKGCTNGDCTKTFDNVCKLCNDSNYPWYYTGVCIDDQLSCKTKKNCLASLKNQAVCAFFNSANGDINKHTTVSSAQKACSDPAVHFYIKGKCGPGRDDITYCLPNYRPQACTREYDPVCGFYMADNDALEHKIMSNPCTACADKSIIYHQPGACVFKCDRNPLIIVDCTGIYEPACGSYTEGGETKYVSLRNGCVGCYDSLIKIDSYTDGLCPGDEGILCKNDASDFATPRIFSVCGLFTKGCTENPCRQTFAEPVAACSDPRVVLYKAGMCPGDEGISCELYRSKPSEESILGFIIYENVCGYEMEGCTRSPCRQTYVDQFDACSRDSVKFFKEGPCS